MSANIWTRTMLDSIPNNIVDNLEPLTFSLHGIETWKLYEMDQTFVPYTGHKDYAYQYCI